MILFLNSAVKTVIYQFKNWLILIFCFVSVISCNEGEQPSVIKGLNTRSIYIQPLNGFDTSISKEIANKLKVLSDDIIILPNLILPKTALNTTGKRYRADSIIRFLKSKTPTDCITLGLIVKDISTTKGDNKDWGVMGLGYRPGNACVASTFRLSNRNKQEQLFKVAIHELGHTIGLPHCTEKNCYMRDAEGHNPTDDEKEFCVACKKKLTNLGWTLNL